MDKAKINPGRYADWTPAENFVQRLVRLRNERGWSYGDMHEVCGLSKGYLHTVFNGANPGLGSLYKIAKAFGLTVSQLLDGVDLQEWEQK